MISFKVVHKDNKEPLTPNEIEMAVKAGATGGITFDWLTVPRKHTEEGVLEVVVDGKYELQAVEGNLKSLSDDEIEGIANQFVETIDYRSAYKDAIPEVEIENFARAIERAVLSKQRED